MEQPLHPLRKWRLSQSLTLDAAGAAVGSVRSTWHEWETGRRIPDRDFMLRLYLFTKGTLDANSFHFPYGFPDLNQAELPLADAPVPLIDAIEKSRPSEPMLEEAA